MTFSAEIHEADFARVWPQFWRTPFYAEKLSQYGLSRNTSLSVRELGKVPFTTKEELRKSSPLARTPYSLSEVQKFMSSSGTTGKPTVYAWVEADEQELMLASGKILTWLGVHAEDLALVLAPMGMPVIGHCMVNQYKAVGAGVIPLGVAGPEQILSALNDFPVSAIATLPEVAGALHQFAVASQRTIARSVRQFHLGGSYLSESRRRRIEAAWGNDAYNMFGLSEVFGPIAGETPEKHGLKLACDRLYLEVISPDSLQPVAEGESGIAVFTSLWEKGSPLLRYWSDDMIRVLAGQHKETNGAEGVYIQYLGKSSEKFSSGANTFFAVELDELILSHPVGNTYEVRMRQNESGDYVEVQVEENEGWFEVAPLREQLEALTHLPARIRVLRPGGIATGNPKSPRVFDVR